MQEKGVKFDSGKPQYGLIPALALNEIAAVLTAGLKKYPANNWRHVEDAERRYFDAAQRHLWAWKSGAKFDDETGLNHLGHALCCIMFLLEKEIENEIK